MGVERRQRPRSVRSLFWGTVVLVTTIMSLLTGYTLWVVGQEVTTLRSAGHQAADLQKRLSSLQRLVLMSAIPLGQYMHESDPDQAKQFSDLAFLVDVDLMNLLRNPSLQDQGIGDLITLSGQWHDVKALSHIILFENGQSPEAAQAWAQLDDLILAMTDRLEQMEQRHLTRAIGNVDRAQDMVGRAPWIFLAGLLIALAAGTWSVLRIHRVILRPIQTLRLGAERLRDGDLSHRMELRGATEFQELAAAFNAMGTALARHRADLVEQTVRDPLTGLYNRRALMARLRQTTANPQVGHCALLMLDLDHFKAVNDQHGHQVGDLVLQDVARVIQAAIRDDDLPVRYGGEEMAVLLPRTSKRGALKVAERIRQRVAESTLTLPDQTTLKVTTSIGVALFPADAPRADALIAAADEALYAAKHLGRNQVCYLNERAPGSPGGSTPSASASSSA